MIYVKGAAQREAYTKPALPPPPPPPPSVAHYRATRALRAPALYPHLCIFISAFLINKKTLTCIVIIFFSPLPNVHVYAYVQAMLKLVKMKVLVVGLRGVGIEVAKNTALAGVQTLTLHDPAKAEMRDLGKRKIAAVAKTTIPPAHLSLKQEDPVGYHAHSPRCQ